MENQSGEALLDLGQVCQLVEDFGVVKHAAELLRTHAVGVDVHHGTGALLSSSPSNGHQGQGGSFGWRRGRC